ncbi:MAG: hypothetical protein V3S55_08635 [Nitrospiraceae bacterium]
MDALDHELEKEHGFDIHVLEFVGRLGGDTQDFIDLLLGDDTESDKTIPEPAAVVTLVFQRLFNVGRRDQTLGNQNVSQPIHYALPLSVSDPVTTATGESGTAVSLGAQVPHPPPVRSIQMARQTVVGEC